LGPAEATAALSRQGRYAQIAENLQVNEVKLDDTGDRFIVCPNPDEADRDQHVREHPVARLIEKITATDRAGCRRGPAPLGLACGLGLVAYLMG
jgi:hypothetical protein